MIYANNPELKSWVEVEQGSDFPIQNLPFGVFKTAQLSPRVGVAIGNKIVDLQALSSLGYLDNLAFDINDFSNDKLNSLMKKGKANTTELRNRIAKLLSTENNDLSGNLTSLMYLNFDKVNIVQ